MYWPAQILFLIDAETCIKSKGSCILPGAIENDRALTNGSVSSSSTCSAVSEEGVAKLADGECCCMLLVVDVVADCCNVTALGVVVDTETVTDGGIS